MLNKNKRILGLTVLCFLLSTVFIFALQQSASTSYSVNRATGYKSLIDDNLQINSSGETYGSLASIKDGEKEPDLIAALGIDGTEGYIRNSDLNKDLPKSPEEAVLYTKSRKNRETHTLI